MWSDSSPYLRIALAVALLFGAWTAGNLLIEIRRPSPAGGGAAAIENLESLQGALEELKRQTAGEQTEEAARRSERLWDECVRRFAALTPADPALASVRDQLRRANAWVSVNDIIRRRLSLRLTEPERNALESELRANLALAGAEVSGAVAALRNPPLATLSNGRRRWVEALIISCAAAFLVFGLLIGHQIHEKRTRKQHLAPSSADVRADCLLQASRDAIVIMDQGGRIEAANSAAARLFGYPAEAIVGQFLPFLFASTPTGAEQKPNFAAIDGRESTGEGTELRGEGRKKDGSTFPLELSLARYYDNHRLMVVGLMRDQTQSMPAFRLRLEESAFLDRVFETAGAPILVLDREGKIVRFNRACEELTEYSVQDVRGHLVWEYQEIPEGSRDPKLVFSRMVTGCFPHTEEQTWRSKSGRLHRITWSRTALANRHGHVEYVVAVGHEAQPQAAPDADAVRQEAKVLAERVARGFNHLLTSINGYSDLVLSFIDSSHPLRKDVEEIRRAGERAADLARQLQAFGRRSRPAPSPFDPAAEMAAMESELRQLLGEQVQLVLRLNSSAGLVSMDPEELRLIVRQLALNAAEAMPRGGSLTIELGAVDEMGTPQICLLMRDTGSGMDAEVMSHLFEPLFTTKPPGRGTGLGLAIIHDLVVRNGGSIHVESEPGSGSTFCVLLPRLQNHAAQQAAAAAAQDNASA